MKEAGLVIGLNNEVVYEFTPPQRSSSYLPDKVAKWDVSVEESPSLWHVLWRHRDSLAGFAHSHPGSGKPFPSVTDLTTFHAVERGLGRRLKWWIASSSNLVLIEWEDDPKIDEWGGSYWSESVQEPHWTTRLRELSALQ